jgi:ATP-binding cassette subfamily B protein
MKRTKETKNKISFQESLKTSLRVMGTYWRMDKLNLTLRTLIATLQVLATISATYVGGLIVGQLVESVNQGFAQPELYRLAVLEVAILLVGQLSSSIDAVLVRIIYLKWDEYFTFAFNAKRAELDISYYEDRSNQKIINKVAEKGGWMLDTLSEQHIFLYKDLLQIIVIAGAILTLGTWVVVLLVLASLPGLYSRVKRSKLQWHIWDSRGDDFHRHWKTINLFNEPAKTTEVKLYGLKDKLLYGIAGKNLKKFNDEQVKAAKSTFGLEAAANSLYRIVILFIFVIMLNRTVSGELTIAEFTFLNGVIASFSTSLTNMTSIFSTITDKMLYVKDFFKIIDSASELRTPDKPIKLNKTEIPTIEFKNVSFTYRSNPKEKILHNLNLTINPGEHLALVGENGAGKTTIIKLLLRLYDVTEGEILVNGINIKELDLDSYWRQIGVLFQDFNRYPFDIQTNIELGRVTKTPAKKEIDRAVELANMNPILNKLPKGINTILDNSFEEGVEPSGGQWQRVALARAFYRNSNILILDEPTAAVDANAEYEIFNNIFAHYGEKTALIISHRFSTVKRANRIVVLDKGRIIEEGTHRDLMKNSKLYSEMFTKQAEGYQD